jgi:3-oxoacyl-[acyl-carrier protein] reductase
MNLDDERSVEGVVDELLGSGSSPDALVMNATWHGGGTTGSGLGVQLDAAVGTTLAGHIQILSAVAPLMARRRRGRVVFIGSVGATFGGRDEAAYTAAKSGLVGLMRTVARELGGRGVTANLVAPGPMDSEAFGDRPLRWRRRASAAIPAQRPATCREVSAVVEFLLSDRAASITGQVLAVDGGLAAAMAP